MPYLGGTEVATLTVDPFDDTTVATITVTKPDGSTATVDAPVTGDGGHTWTTPITYDLADGWVLLWTVTGMGAGVRPYAVFVTALPVPGGPSWRPDLSKVASYIPNRTLARGTINGSNVAVLTFDNTTKPPGPTVDALLTDGIAWVLTATGPTIAAGLTPMAAAVAAAWTAAQVERGWPDRPQDVTTAADLLAMAERMRADLVAANAAATGTQPTDPVATLLPMGQFPPPVPWGDRLLL